MSAHSRSKSRLGSSRSRRSSAKKRNSPHNSASHRDIPQPLRLTPNSKMIPENIELIPQMLHKNILTTRQATLSAKGSRKPTVPGALVAATPPKLPQRHAWVRLGAGGLPCSSRLSSNSQLELLDNDEDNLTRVGSPVPVENKHLPPMIRLDDASSSSYMFSVTSMDGSEAPTEKLEDLLTSEHLEAINKFFEDIETSGSGTHINQPEFNHLMCSLLTLKNYHSTELDALFKKIDYDSTGRIDWDKFCTYMHLKLSEKDVVLLKQNRVPLPNVFSPDNTHTPHRDNKIESVNFQSDNSLMTLSKDGVICNWSKELVIKRTKQPEHTYRPRPKWVTDLAIMQAQNKIALSTGDHEIQFYELASFEPCCQISNLDSVPVCLTYSADSTSVAKCLIAAGDDHGCISVLLFENIYGCLRVWNKSYTSNSIPTISIEKVIQQMTDVKHVKWKVHQEWVTALSYYPSIDKIISCCSDAETSVVIWKTLGSTRKDANPGIQAGVSNLGLIKKSLTHQPWRRHLPGDQLVFKVRKGVKSFDFNKEMNILVTGGSDRIIRIWNPYLPHRTTAKLMGHSNAIHFLAINSIDLRLISVDNEKIIKVWDLKEYSCLLNIGVKYHKIQGDILACGLHKNRLVICTEFPTVLTFHGYNNKLRSTHKTPVTSVLYNKVFDCIVSGCIGSVVKLWDVATGCFIFEFTDLHPNGGVTCMTFDKSGRRLITGSDNGEVKIWNYNNGQFLRYLDKGNNQEVTDVAYVSVHKNQYIVSVGWDKELHVFSDIQDSIHTRQTESQEWKQKSSHSSAKNNTSKDYHQTKNTYGHKEDILAVAYGLPNFLATASFDGEIIVWSMVSGHIFCKLIVPHNARVLNIDNDRSVSSLLFLDARSRNRRAASLVANGPNGKIHFWNLYNGGVLQACFQVSRQHGPSKMTSDVQNMLLVVGDFAGFVSIWDIHNYCLNNCELNSPPMLRIWRAHTDIITCIELVEKSAIVVTASKDCNVRLWTLKSQYIGTFGIDAWNINDISSFKHPFCPEDVLIESLSLPSLDNEPTEETRDSDVGIKERHYYQPSQLSDYDDNEDQIRLPRKEEAGKRLRQEGIRISRQDSSGRTYQVLSIEELDNTQITNSLESLIYTRPTTNKSDVKSHRLIS